MKHCCICGKILPNRYAIGGSCEHPNCSEVFCQYHWREGLCKCSNHRGGELNNTASEQKQNSVNENIVSTDSKDEILATKGKASSIMNKFLGGVKNLKKVLVKDPREEIKKYEKALEDFEQNRANLLRELEEVDKQIVAKKKQFEVAPSFRKTILKKELETLLAKHSNYERRINAILENEKNLSSVISRTKESLDIAAIPLSETVVDKITSRLETAIDKSEGVADAVKDLDKIKGVSSASMDDDDFNQMLDMFGGDDIPELSNNDKDISLASFDNEENEKNNSESPIQE